MVSAWHSSLSPPDAAASQRQPMTTRPLSLREARFWHRPRTTSAATALSLMLCRHTDATTHGESTYLCASCLARIPSSGSIVPQARRRARRIKHLFTTQLSALSALASSSRVRFLLTGHFAPAMTQMPSALAKIIKTGRCPGRPSNSRQSVEQAFMDKPAFLKQGGVPWLNTTYH